MSKKIIGKGAYGTIFNIEGIAVKKIKHGENGINTPEPVIMSNFKHENINTALKIKIGAGSILIYQNLAEKDLWTHLKDMKVTNESWVQDIFKGLAFLHQNSVIHCDLKSQNILIFKESVKITDFSLSIFAEKENLEYKSWETGTEDAVICTSTHRPPEVWNKQKHNWKADIWSLGCLLFEMKHRSNLFSGFLETKDMIIQMKKFFSNPDIYLGGDLIIKKCLSFDPSQRPEAAELVTFCKGAETVECNDQKFTRRKLYEKIYEKLPNLKKRDDLALYMTNKLLGSPIFNEDLSFLEANILKNLNCKMDLASLS